MTPSPETKTMTEGNEKVFGELNRILDEKHSERVILASRYTAFTASTQFGPDVPALYRRTWLLGVAFGPVIAAVAGMFDYDCDVWVLKGGKFRPVVLTKRKGL